MDFVAQYTSFLLLLQFPQRPTLGAIFAGRLIDGFSLYSPLGASSIFPSTSTSAFLWQWVSSLSGVQARQWHPCIIYGGREHSSYMQHWPMLSAQSLRHHSIHCHTVAMTARCSPRKSCFSHLVSWKQAVSLHTHLLWKSLIGLQTMTCLTRC